MKLEREVMSKKLKQTKWTKVSAWAALAGAVALVFGSLSAHANVFDTDVRERALGEMRVSDHHGSQLQCAALDAKSSLDDAESEVRVSAPIVGRSAASIAR